MCKPNVHNLNNIIVDYICKQTQQLLRMNDTQISKAEHVYTLPTRRNKSQQNKGWRNQHQWRLKKPGNAYTLSLTWHDILLQKDWTVQWIGHVTSRAVYTAYQSWEECRATWWQMSQVHQVCCYPNFDMRSTAVDWEQMVSFSILCMEMQHNKATLDIKYDKTGLKDVLIFHRT